MAIRVFFYLYTSRFHKKQLNLSDCVYACSANCTLNLPQDCFEIFFSFCFYPTFVNKKSLSCTCEIYKFACVTADTMQIKLPILSDVFQYLYLYNYSECQLLFCQNFKE